MELDIRFNSENHTYTVNGKKATSVTQILRAVGLGKDFSDMNDAVKQKVKAAAERGNYYDELAAEALEDDFEINEWQERFLETIKQHNLPLKRSQARFGTLSPYPIAGTADFDGDLIIADLKATYMIYINDVTWQTNIYSYLKSPEKHKDIEKYVIHYDEKVDKFSVVKLKHIPEEKILKVFECFQLEELYVDNEVSKIGKVSIQEFSQAYDKVEQYKEYLKEEEEKLNTFYSEIKKHMNENAIKSFDLENFKITYTPKGTRNTVNYVNISEERNKSKIESINKILVEHGFDPLVFVTVEDVKKDATEKELKENTKVANVSDRLTITAKKK